VGGAGDPERHEAAGGSDGAGGAGFADGLRDAERAGRVPERDGAGQAAGGGSLQDLPEPPVAPADRPYGILVTGVGGTGVVTIGALLGTAATLEGKGVSVLDMAGLAQKGGPVWSHVRIAARQDVLHASRIAAGEANLLLGCDIVVAVADESLSKLRAGTTRAVVNSDFSVTSDFVRAFAAQATDRRRRPHPRPAVPGRRDGGADRGGGRSRPGRLRRGTRLATALLGDSIAANLFMVGYAYQRGCCRCPRRPSSRRSS
jgi:indolepyruvate ferredoxin oxidoreductase